MPDAPRITLLGRPGCHLCEEARAVVAQVAADAGLTWQERSVDDEPGLRDRYGDLVPVVLVDGVQHACWRVDPGRLAAAVEQGGARRRRRWRVWSRGTP